MGIKTAGYGNKYCVNAAILTMSWNGLIKEIHDKNGKKKQRGGGGHQKLCPHPVWNQPSHYIKFTWVTYALPC